MGAKNIENKTPATDAGISIYGYTNYRDFLRDFYQFKKESARGYSYRSFSKAAGFSSPNILKLVIDGKRNISNEAIEKFSQALRLSPSMNNYFRALVKMNQSKTDEDKEKYFDILKRLTPHGKKRQLNAEEHQYLSNWLYPVIREMIDMGQFKEDPYWISRRLVGQANVNEISSALRFLIKEGFIEKDEQGNFKSNDQMVISSDEVKSLAIRNYHRQMIDQGKETLESLPMSEREFGALTMCLPEKAMEELKFKLKNFRRDLHEWAVQAANDYGSETVIQLNMQMYPHTKKKEANGEK